MENPVLKLTRSDLRVPNKPQVVTMELAHQEAVTWRNDGSYDHFSLDNRPAGYPILMDEHYAQVSDNLLFNTLLARSFRHHFMDVLSQTAGSPHALEALFFFYLIGTVVNEQRTQVVFALLQGTNSLGQTGAIELGRFPRGKMTHLLLSPTARSPIFYDYHFYDAKAK